MSRAHTLQRDKRNGVYFAWIRRNRVSKYFAFGVNKRAACEKLRQLENDIEAGKIAFASVETSVVQANGKTDVRIEELAHRHLEWVEANRCKETLKNRQLYVRKFVKFFGPVMVSEITRLRLEQFYTHERKLSGDPNAGYEAMRNIRTMLRWAEECEIADLAFRRFPRLSYTLPDTRRVSEDEFRRLLASADQDMRDLIMFGTLTGLRPFEMRNLWHENIRHDDTGTSYLFIDKDVKGAKMARMPKPRSVPLCKEAEAIIERQFTAHPQSPFIFLSESGVPYTRYTLRDRFRRLAKSCGLKGIVPYSLRHTFASLQAAGGTETTSLAQLMGHSSVRTLQRYVVNTAKEHKEAMDRNERRLMAMLDEGGKNPKSESKETDQVVQPVNPQ